MTEAPLIRFTISLDTLGHVVAVTEKVPESVLRIALDSWNLDYENTKKLISLLREAEKLFEHNCEQLENYMQAI